MKSRSQTYYHLRICDKLLKVLKQINCEKYMTHANFINYYENVIQILVLWNISWVETYLLVHNEKIIKYLSSSKLYISCNYTLFLFIVIAQNI